MSKQQDIQNLEALLQSWGPKIYGLALRLSCRPQEAEDIAQETFLKAFKHWESFRSESEVGTWLYRICVNIWKNQVRRERRRSFWERISVLKAGFSHDGKRPEDVPAADAPLDSGLQLTEQRQRLEQTLAQLEPDDRAILVMREIEDRSYEEISQWLGVPMGTVKSRLARTRQKLKSLYSYDRTA